MTNKKVQLIDGDRTIEFDKVLATQGNDGFDISSLLHESGMVTLDTGFMNTANCTSDITYIDGDAGILRYRGYPIEQLAERSSFLEVAYLLMHGELPTSDELQAWQDRIDRHSFIKEDFKEVLAAVPRNAHPMATLAAAIQTMTAFYPESVDPLDPDAVELASVLLLAKMPTIISYIYRRAQGYALLYPNRGEGYTQNFARMIFARPGEEFQRDPVLFEALDQLLILHADHEQNCSTSTVRMVGSSHANLYASISAGVGALSGPLHGGANEAVVRMLTQIKESGMSVQDYVDGVKSKKAGHRLMGFGHRVYKNYDPRAAIVKKTAEKVLKALNLDDDLLSIGMEIENIALNDDYFIERKLYPNVDFYTGIIYKAMGFPAEMFTPLFALGRLPGWISQWREMINDPVTKIGRPRQVYVGPAERDYLAMDNRG